MAVKADHCDTLEYMLAEFLLKHGRRGCVALTGAGCSTESGIPDYRGPHGRYRREDFVPLTFQRFMQHEDERKRYWARSMLGYSVMSGVSSNPTHMGLDALAKAGVISRILTQNVDGLHHLAAHGGVGDASPSGYVKYTSSSSPLTEIHGNIHLVRCMRCAHIEPRVLLQKRMQDANRALMEAYAADLKRVRPDGDYVAPDEVVKAIRLVGCSCCGGDVRPHVVLFGENIPRAVAEETTDCVRHASCLVCLGTSLHVFSAYRYVLAAKEACVPIAIVNAGTTRGDGQEDVKINTESTAAVLTDTVKAILGKDLSLFRDTATAFQGR